MVEVPAFLPCRVAVPCCGTDEVGEVFCVDVSAVPDFDAVLFEFSTGGDEEGDGVPEKEEQQEKYCKEEDQYAADEVGEGNAGCCGGFAVGVVPVAAFVIGLGGGSWRSVAGWLDSLCHRCCCGCRSGWGDGFLRGPFGVEGHGAGDAVVEVPCLRAGCVFVPAGKGVAVLYGVLGFGEFVACGEVGYDIKSGGSVVEENAVGVVHVAVGGAAAGGRLWAGFFGPFGMEDQIILKSPPEKELLSILEEEGPEFMYMAIIKSAEQYDALEGFNVRTVAVETNYQDEDNEIASDEFISRLHDDGLMAWANALTLDGSKRLTAGHDDNISITADPDDGWGYLLDKGYDIIQTDWPSLLIDYMNRRSR